MNLIFVHGWSVTHTNTYGDLPESLSKRAGELGLTLDISHIYLGKYVSFKDEVTLDDVANSLDSALRKLPGNTDVIQPFSCITHSTGGPVVRHWVNKFFGARGLSGLPLVHLVMLAPANHGSSLAVLGKKRVGQIKSWFSGIEPGQKVLDWLSLGSEGQWQLNRDYLSYRCAKWGFYPFVLIGQGIDTKFYDFVNGYLVEPGSDGVVRVAGANVNYRYLSLKQTEQPIGKEGNVLRLEYNRNRPVKRAEQTPIGIFSGYSHSGSKMGIMAVRGNRPNLHNPIVAEVLSCLAVETEQDYKRRSLELCDLTTVEQSKNPTGKPDGISRYSMLVFRVSDHVGTVIDYRNISIYLLAGESYDPDKLPKGFFVDKQMNRESNSLVYYVDADAMSKLKDGLYGLRIVVRPQEGFSCYVTGEFRSDGIPIDRVFAPNETTYIDIVMNRYVDENVFRFAPATDKRKSFKKVKPSGRTNLA